MGFLVMPCCSNQRAFVCRIISASCLEDSLRATGGTDLIASMRSRLCLLLSHVRRTPIRLHPQQNLCVCARRLVCRVRALCGAGDRDYGDHGHVASARSVTVCVLSPRCGSRTYAWQSFPVTPCRSKNATAKLPTWSFVTDHDILYLRFCPPLWPCTEPWLRFAVTRCRSKNADGEPFHAVACN